MGLKYSGVENKIIIYMQQVRQSVDQLVRRPATLRAQYQLRSDNAITPTSHPDTRKGKLVSNCNCLLGKISAKVMPSREARPPGHVAGTVKQNAHVRVTQPPAVLTQGRPRGGAKG